MDQDAFLAQYDRHERRDARVPTCVREEGAYTVRLVNAAGTGRGCVMYAALDASTADAAIDAEIARFREIGQDFEWKLHGHDLPTDLGDRLLARGFAREPEETLLAFDLAADLPEAVAGVAVRAVGPDEADLVFALNRDAFGKARRAHVDSLFEELAKAPDSTSIHVAYVDGEPAACGTLRTSPEGPFASLWGGGTVPGLRRRGAYRALVAERLRIARDRGFRHAYVDAGAESLPILQQLGFEAVVRMHPMVWRVA